MTQLSNVPMQPNPSAVERLTLVEKLEQQQKFWENNPKCADGTDYTDFIKEIQICIDTVKQHEAESEVQEKIYQQEMDKIKFCGCGCILSNGSTQCSDCEVQDD